MPRIKWVDDRLEEWAMWREGAGLYRSISYDREVSGDAVGLVELSAEQEAGCVEIDMAVAKLPAELKQAVFAFYTWQGGMGVITEKLRVTRATIHRRLCHADLRIVEWFDARSQPER
ncbi:hypothetical protein JT27_15700 [Alcaligenes faecalis]|uniref:hypothetical protein n=1 Tax=Alcaligenes faecalis TaxID=511 RepID=UPI00052CDBB0|nr:hypothetical protein [Alcaligenes faecalis]KGP00559.1 hypothetical protein JT27_15700 [Alcaligenes faecalis]